MGQLLREVLRCLCREGGWSYAVFWKIACQNPSLLVWEEGHYELVRHYDQPSTSGTGSTLLPKESNALWNPFEHHFSRAEHQAVDGIDMLVDKKMMPQVHVIGEGIVGRAAFMGSHQWILRETYLDGASMSKVQAEVQHQFLAGMQTIAVIPVLPHGVVQLGSIQRIVENLGFVSHVKSLFVQIGTVRGALLSDPTNNAINQKIKVPISLGIPVSADRSGNACVRAARFTPTSGDISNQQLLRTPGVVSQPSFLVTQIQHNMQANALFASSTSKPTGIAIPKSHGACIHPKAVSVVKHSFPLGYKLENEATGSHFIFPNPDMQFNQQKSSYNSTSGSNHLTSVVRTGIPCRDIKFMDQQVLSGLGSQGPTNNHVHGSIHNTKNPLLGSNGCTAFGSLTESGNVSALGRSESNGNGLGMEASISNQSNAWGSIDNNLSCVLLEGRKFANQADIGVLPVSMHLNNSNTGPSLSGESLPIHFSGFKQTGDGGTTGESRIFKDLFEYLENPLADTEKPISWFESMPLGPVQDRWLSNSKSGEVSQIYQSSICEESGILTACCGESIKDSEVNQFLSKLNEIPSDAMVRPSAGSDLFDALGLDSKTEQHSHGWDDLILHQADECPGKLMEDVSSSLSGVGMPIFGAVNDGVSESGIFTESGPDNLLDAVVSQIHSAPKPYLDDNVSCRTTLTESNSSSAQNKFTYNAMPVLEKMQGELVGCTQAAPPKPDIAGSSYSKTKCGLNITGGCSQTDTTFNSQICSWVEDGQNAKRDSNSTAHSKRPDEEGRSNRKRLRPGENPRPRPKDRQMIQDRVKELREIVPNGAKCSIDALLERTIKHMVFLQSVTKHADQLKQTGESKIISKEGGLLLKDNFEGGKTVAFEVGSRSIPIIVEDLNQPRQMLVEMLCEERGFFLEIADIIRGLGLTILKGVMEAREDKIWARFAVEANRDVTRINIFMSLVRLLEQTMKGNTTPKGFDGSNVGQSFYHQSSIPVTGLAGSSFR